MFIAIALMFGFQLSASAEVSTEKIKEGIVKEKVFAPETKLRVSVEGAEATVTTFKIVDAKSDDDYKIDAVLVGKSVFATDPGIARVTSRFYDLRNTKDYFEVPVTVGDVKAFGAGSISQKQLLSAILMTVHKEPSVKLEKIAQPAKSVYKDYGLELSYPTTWKIEHPHEGTPLARFSAQGETEQPTIVDLKLYSRPVTAQQASRINPEALFGKSWKIAWLRYMASRDFDWTKVMSGHHHRHSNPDSHSGTPHHEEHDGQGWAEHGVRVSRVQLPETLKLGSGKTIAGYQRAYWATSPYSPREYMRTVAFSSGKYVYQLLLLCAEENASSANGEFEQLLSDIKFSSAEPAKKPAGSAATK